MAADQYLTFLDIDADHIVNAVPMPEVRCVPRVGETVFLPGTPEDDGALYQVVEVRYGFSDDPEAEVSTGAKLDGITVSVRMLPPDSEVDGGSAVVQ